MTKEKLKHKEVRKMIKRNEFQDMLVEAREYIEKNMENLVIFGVIALIVIVAIPLYFNHKKSQEVKAEGILSEANHYINRPVIDDEQAAMYGYFRSKEEKFDKAVTKYMEVVQGYKGTKSHAPAYIGIANAYYNSGKYKEALEYFNTFIENYPKHALAGKAVSGRAYTQYQLGNYKEALAGWERAASEYRDSVDYYDVMLRQADCLVKLKQDDKAKEIYVKIEEDAKDTYWATAAGKKLKELK